jgi:hypothetical protein
VFFKEEEFFLTHLATQGIVNFYGAGVVTHGDRLKMSFFEAKAK